MNKVAIAEIIIVNIVYIVNVNVVFSSMLIMLLFNYKIYAHTIYLDIVHHSFCCTLFSNTTFPIYTHRSIDERAKPSLVVVQT